MMGTERILAGFDGSDESRDALHLASVLAQIKGSRLEVVAVLLHHPLEPRLAADPDDAAAYFDWAFSEARNELPGIPISRWDLQASAISAARALSDLAVDEDIDLIVVGSTHRGPWGRVMPGSVGERLVHAAPCPVAITPRGFVDREYFRLGVVGIAYYGPEESESALQWTQDLAVELDAKLRIITTVNRPSPGWLGGPRAGSLRAQLRGALESAAASVGSVLEVEPVFEEGESAAVLATHGAELDLLALGSRGNSLVRRTWLRGVSAGVTRAAPCPVVVVPSGIAPRADGSADVAASAARSPPPA